MAVRSGQLTCHPGLVLPRDLEPRMVVTRELANEVILDRAPHRIKHSIAQKMRTRSCAMAADAEAANPERTPSQLSPELSSEPILPLL